MGVVSFGSNGGSHSHANTSILSLFSVDSNNQLLWNNKAINMGMIQEFSIAPSNPTISFDGSWATNPGNLSNIFDGNDSTASSLGYVGGNAFIFGNLNFDLGLQLPPYSGFSTKFGLRNSNGGSNNAFYSVEYQSLANNQWYSLWGIIGAMPSASSTIYSMSFYIKETWQKARFRIGDIGQFSAAIEVFFVKPFYLQ